MHKVVAQAITNSIMITDDHKANAPTASVPSLNSVGPDAGQVPGAGVFATSSNVDMSIPVGSQHPFRLSHSATDLQGAPAAPATDLQADEETHERHEPAPGSGAPLASATDLQVAPLAPAADLQRLLSLK